MKSNSSALRHRCTFLITAFILATLSGCGDGTPSRTTGDAEAPATPPAPTTPSAKPPSAVKTLAQARHNFQTLAKGKIADVSPADDATGSPYQLIRYRAEPGMMAAYVVPDPGDGKKHPAILWAHGGFGGIGSSYWTKQPASNDQSPRAFLEAGFIVMVPSWRGENDNPGNFELFFGEVNDAVAAIDYLSQLPYVDTQRIYMAGHSTGGTITLLTALSDPRLRAAFSFGGAPDVARVVGDGVGYGNTPYDHRIEKESRLRSAIHFVESLQVPTFYFEGENSSYCDDARIMEQRARAAGTPFQASIIERGSHFNILRPLTHLIAAKLKADTGPQFKVTLTTKEVQDAFDAAQAAAQKNRKIHFSLTPAAAAQMLEIIKDQEGTPQTIFLRLGIRSDGTYSLDLTEKRDAQNDLEFQSHGITIIAEKSIAKKMGIIEVDFNGKGFRIVEGDQD